MENKRRAQRKKKKDEVEEDNRIENEKKTDNTKRPLSTGRWACVASAHLLLRPLPCHTISLVTA